MATVGGGAQQLVWPEQRPGESFLTIAGTITAGTAPVSRNQVVPHGRPQAWPGEHGAYGEEYAVAKSTGSPGASQDTTVSGCCCR